MKTELLNLYNNLITSTNPPEKVIQEIIESVPIAERAQALSDFEKEITITTKSIDHQIFQDAQALEAKRAHLNQLKQICQLFKHQVPKDPACLAAFPKALIDQVVAKTESLEVTQRVQILTTRENAITDAISSLDALIANFLAYAKTKEAEIVRLNHLKKICALFRHQVPQDLACLLGLPTPLLGSIVAQIDLEDVASFARLSKSAHSRLPDLLSTDAPRLSKIINSLIHKKWFDDLKAFLARFLCNQYESKLTLRLNPEALPFLETLKNKFPHIQQVSVSGTCTLDPLRELPVRAIDMSFLALCHQPLPPQLESLSLKGIQGFYPGMMGHICRMLDSQPSLKSLSLEFLVCYELNDTITHLPRLLQYIAGKKNIASLDLSLYPTRIMLAADLPEAPLISRDLKKLSLLIETNDAFIQRLNINWQTLKELDLICKGLVRPFPENDQPVRIEALMLRLDGLDPTNVSQFLQRCHSLKKCRFQLLNEESSDMSQIVLPSSVEELEICGYSTAQVVRGIGQLLANCRNLKSIVVNFARIDWTSVPNTFVLPSLEFLNLVSEKEAPILSRCCPNLKRVIVEENDRGEFFTTFSGNANLEEVQAHIGTKSRLGLHKLFQEGRKLRKITIPFCGSSQVFSKIQLPQTLQRIEIKRVDQFKVPGILSSLLGKPPYPRVILNDQQAQNPKPQL